jgi:hypothetical protein
VSDPDPLAAITAALQVVRTADEALRAAVDRARAAGHTWQTIGDLLGTSRQAAFQRFGRPIDPRTGKPMSQALLPEAAALAVNLLADYAAGKYETVRSHFDYTMLDAVSLEKLAEGHAQVTGLIGAYESMGEPFARVIGDYTVVDVPLQFEAGDMVGRVSYSADRKVAGLFVMKPEAA